MSAGATKTAPDGAQPRWAVLGVLVFARTCMALQFYTVPPLLPLMVAQEGWSYGQAGLLFGLFMAPGVVLALPGGLLGRRFGDRPVVLGALVALGAGGGLLALAPGFGWAVAGRLLAGVGGVLLNVQLTKVATDRFVGRELSTALAALLATWPLGNALALASLGGVAAATSWRVAAGLAALLVLPALVLVLGGLRPPAGAPAREVGAAFTGVLGLAPRELVLVAAAGLVWMCVNGAVAVFYGFAPALLVARGAAPGPAGALVSVASWLAMGWAPVAGYLTDRTGWINRIVVGGSLLAGGAVAAVGAGVGPALGWIVLFGLAGSSQAGGIMALPAQVLRPAHRSAGFGVFYTAYYLAIAVVPAVAGTLRDGLVSAAAPVYLSAGLMLGSIAMLAVFRALQRAHAVA